MIDKNFIVSNWKHITPDELRQIVHDPAPALIQLSPRNKRERVYVAPRERITSDLLPTICFDAYDPQNSLAPIEEKLQKYKKIVLVYPTSREHLEHSAADPSGNIHDKELRRLDQKMSRWRPSNSRILETVKVNLENKHQVKVEFLPMVKLTGKIETNTNCVKPTRFWTSSAPPKNAAYIVLDDTLETGATLKGILSHLKAHGVPDDNILAVCADPEHSGRVVQSAEQREFVRDLRAYYPNIASRADIILQLIGIESIEALTHYEACMLDIVDKKFSTPERFDDSVKLLVSNIQNYSTIPEPDSLYVNKIRNTFSERTR